MNLHINSGSFGIVPGHTSIPLYTKEHYRQNNIQNSDSICTNIQAHPKASGAFEHKLGSFGVVMGCGALSSSMLDTPYLTACFTRSFFQEAPCRGRKHKISI